MVGCELISGDMAVGISQHHVTTTSTSHYTQLPDTEPAHDVSVSYPTGVESVEVIHPSVSDLIYTYSQVVGIYTPLPYITASNIC